MECVSCSTKYKTSWRPLVPINDNNDINIIRSAALRKLLADEFGPLVLSYYFQIYQEDTFWFNKIFEGNHLKVLAKMLGISCSSMTHKVHFICMHCECALTIWHAIDDSDTRVLMFLIELSHNERRLLLKNKNFKSFSDFKDIDYIRSNTNATEDSLVVGIHTVAAKYLQDMSE